MATGFARQFWERSKTSVFPTEYVKMCLLINAVIITLQQHCKHYGLAHTGRNFSASCHGPAPPLVAFLWTIGSAAGTPALLGQHVATWRQTPKRDRQKQSCCISTPQLGLNPAGCQELELPLLLPQDCQPNKAHSVDIFPTDWPSWSPCKIQWQLLRMPLKGMHCLPHPFLIYIS